MDGGVLVQRVRDSECHVLSFAEADLRAWNAAVDRRGDRRLTGDSEPCLGDVQIDGSAIDDAEPPTRGCQHTRCRATRYETPQKDGSCGPARVGQESPAGEASSVVIVVTSAHRSLLLRRRALPITDTELKLIAAAANMGESRIPKNG